MSNKARQIIPPGTTAERLERNLQGSRLRILIVGAGIAGATLAALLRQRGERPAIIERAGPDAPGGYMLGLLPLGGRVLNGLALHREYMANSVPMKKYVLYNRNGELVREFPLSPIVENYGRYGGIQRGELLKLLRNCAGDIEYGTTVDTVDQTAQGADVSFHDGSRIEVDLIVAADGIHSATRAIIMKDDDVEHFDTGWRGYMFSSPMAGNERDTYRELWSSGWGIGMYPALESVGVFLAGRTGEIQSRDPNEYADEIAHRTLPDPFLNALNHRQRTQPFLWKLEDFRAKSWWRDSTVLLGDAGTAFLPTAGVGASVAMDSAAALADELARANVEHLQYALSLYEKRQRHRAELAQKNSRSLAKLMFIDNPVLAFARDQMLRFYSIERLIRDISRVMEGT